MFLDKDKENLVAIFDIASASVGSALIKCRKGRPLAISCSDRKPLDFSRKKNSASSQRLIVSSIDSAMKEIRKRSNKIDSVMCVFSAPWYISQARVVKIKRASPFEASKELFEKLLDDEADIFQKEWSGNLSRDADGKTTLLEKEQVKTVLNGYEVSKPFGKKFSRLELCMYLSLIPSFLKNALADYFSDFFDNDKIFFRTFPFVLFNVLKQAMDLEEGLVFTDIGGEITDVFVLRENVPEEINSFALGENFFVKKLASGLKLDFFEARDRLAQYQRTEVENVLANKIKSILEPAAKEWGNYFKKTLISMAEEKFLPPKLYLCGLFSFLKELENIFKQPGFNNFTIFGKPFEINKLSPDSFKHYFEAAHGAQANDIYLILSAIFANSRCFNFKQI